MKETVGKVKDDKVNIMEQFQLARTYYLILCDAIFTLVRKTVYIWLLSAFFCFLNQVHSTCCVAGR